MSILKPFMVTVTFTDGQVMFFHEPTRTRAINIAKEYLTYSTVQKAVVMGVDGEITI